MPDKTRQIRIDDLVLEPGSRRLYRATTAIDLPKLSFDLLLALVDGAPSVMTTNQLLDAVWGDTVVSDETLTQRVKMLRDALDNSGDKQHYIETVRGVGYRLRPAVAMMDMTSNSARKVDGRHANERGRWTNVSIVLLVMLAIASIFYLSIVVQDNRAIGLPDGTSIAVLPFVAMSDETDDEHFADGVTEEVLNSLAQLPDLLVTARTSAFYFKGKNLPIEEISAVLGVAHILEGSIRRDGDNLRITAQLVRAEDGFHIWSETIDHTTGDTFAVQMDIAEKVATALEVVLDDASRQSMRNVGIRDPRAFIAYQKGIIPFEQAHGARPGLTALVEANEYFEQAIERAPEFSDAYMKHSDYYSHVLLSLGAGVDIGGYSSSDNADVGRLYFADVDAAIRFARDERHRRLLSLDRSIFAGDWNDLDQQFDRVFSDPVCGSASWLETVALPFGYAADSRALITRWLECDPLSYAAHMHRIRMLTALGDFENLLRVSYESARVIDHPLLRLVPVFALVGMERSEEAKAIVDSRPDDPVMQIGGRFWLASARGDAAEARDSLMLGIDTFNFAPGDLMAYYAIIGDRDEANRIAARADSLNFGHMVLVNALMTCYCGSVFDLEVTPNFARMIEDAGLMWPPEQAIDWPLKTW